MAWYLAGLGLVVLGLVPSSTWIHVLRPSPSAPAMQDQFLMGAGLLRLALAGLGTYLIVGARFGWFHSAERPDLEPHPKSDRQTDLIVAGLLVLALILRLLHLGSGLWVDEVSSFVNYVQKPLGVILTTYDSENQHFAYSVLAHLSTGVFGPTAWALRLPAALLGVGSIWALYRLGRALTTRPEALLAAALMTVFYHHLWFSQNARGYTGALLGTLITSWLFVRAARGNRAADWWPYATTAALGIWFHLTVVFVIMAHAAIYGWRIVQPDRDQSPGRWVPLLNGFIPAAAFTFVLYALGIPQFIASALQEASLVAEWRNPLWTIRETVAGLGLRAVGGAVGLVALAVVGIGTVSYLRTSPVLVAMLGLSVTAVTTTAILMGHHLWPRTLFFALGYGMLIVIRGLAVAGRNTAAVLGCGAPARARAAVAAPVAAILIAAVVLPRAYGPKQDFVGARDFVLSALQPGDTVVVVGIAQYPYRDLYAPHWRTVASGGELEALETYRGATWVLYTFPLHMASEYPDILDVLELQFTLIKAFPGTLRGGTVFVYRTNHEPAATSRTKALCSDSSLPNGDLLCSPIS